jgi:hypothetical protein
VPHQRLRPTVPLLSRTATVCTEPSARV